MGAGFQNDGRQGVAVLMPAAVYRVTQMVEIFQSNVVLRGDGVSAPVLAAYCMPEGTGNRGGPGARSDSGIARRRCQPRTPPVLLLRSPPPHTPPHTCVPLCSRARR